MKKQKNQDSKQESFDNDKKKSMKEQQAKNVDREGQEQNARSGSSEMTQEPETELEVVKELQNSLEGQKDKYLRLFAEFENFKKRSFKEKLELMRSAAQDTLTAILPVLDDFDRAKQVSDDPETKEEFSEGVTMVYNRLYQILQDQGLRAMETEGCEFDPELHEAVSEIPVESKDQKGKILDTIEKGYYLNDKIIRHAKVVVGK